MKITKGIIGTTARSNDKLSIIGAVVFTTSIDITNKIYPINMEPESPINTLRFLLKLNGK
jgi:hypothetical protein